MHVQHQPRRPLDCRARSHALGGRNGSQGRPTGRAGSQRDDVAPDRAASQKATPCELASGVKRGRNVFRPMPLLSDHWCRVPQLGGEVLMASNSKTSDSRSSAQWTVHSSDNSSDPSRGRRAQAPTDIPPKGWRDVLLRVFHGISEDRITTMSGGVTFFVLLALFPGLAGLISLYGLFANSSTIGQHLNSLEGVLPEGGMQILRDQLQQLTSQPAQKLGFATIASLAVSLWSANGGIKAMFEGLNAVYEESEKRSFLKLNAISLALTLGGVTFVIASLLIITVVPT